MEQLTALLAQKLAPYTNYLLLVFAASEILGNIKVVKENSVFQIVTNVIGSVIDLIKKSVTPNPPAPPKP